MRPGRFDSEIHISPPDLRGRKEIFELYLSKVTQDRAIDTEYLAKGTTGFTGADIENMVNQVNKKSPRFYLQLKKKHRFDFRRPCTQHKSVRRQ